MDQSISAFLIGAGIGAYGFLCGNKAFHEEIEDEKSKRRNLLAASREGKLSLQKQLQAKDEEILSLKTKEEELVAALTGEQAKVHAYAAEKKSLKSMNAQNNNDIMELKLKLKDSESVVSKQVADISRLEAALKNEQEKVADFQIQLNRKMQGKVNGEVTELVAIAAGGAATAAVVPVQEGAAVTGKTEGRRSFENIKTTEWESDTDFNAVIKPSRHRSRRLKASGRIAWGQPAKDNEFPFAAYFQGEDFMCSGSLIAPSVVLTAGHCVRDSFGWINKTQTAVFIGSVNWNESPSYKIQAIYTPKYSEHTDYGDIALLHLVSPVPSSVALPVALAPSKFLLTIDSTATSSMTSTTPMFKTATVLGWGKLQTGKMPTMLMYTTESILNKTTCDKYHEDLMGGWPPRDHICFGLDKNPSTGTCGGDSGGPFIVNTNPSASGTASIVQVALVSYGPLTPCGDESIDVATSVMYWRTWIEDMLSIHNMRERKKFDRINVMERKKCFETDLGEEERKKIMTLGKCCEACRANKACKSWTWTEKTKRCAQGTSKIVSKASSDCVSGSFL